MEKLLKGSFFLGKLTWQSGLSHSADSVELPVQESLKINFTTTKTIFAPKKCSRLVFLTLYILKLFSIFAFLG